MSSVPLSTVADAPSPHGTAPQDARVGRRPTEAEEPDEACELCEAARFTHWYHEDERCWVADCEVCSVPMVVWNHHGSAPSAADVDAMLAVLADVAAARFGPDNFEIDRTMRQVPTHFHAHARDPRWWAERMSRPMSRYTGVGGERVVR